MMVQTYLWIGIALFVAMLLVLGYVGYKKTKTFDDYVIGGFSLGPYSLGLALAATFFSAATFMGYVGWSYDMGYSNLWRIFALGILCPLGAVIVAKKVRDITGKVKAVSLPDWCGSRFDSDVLRVMVAILVLFNIAYIAAQISAGAWVFEVMLGIPYRTGVVAVAVVVLLYVTMGGTFSDIYTDAVQAVLMAVCGLLVFFSIYFIMDGSILGVQNEIATNLQQQDANLTRVINPESSMYYSVAAIVFMLFADFWAVGQPQIINKIMALEKKRDMGKLLVTYVVATFCFLLVVWGGFYARALIPEVIAHPDTALPEYVSWAMHPLLAAFVGVVILAASLSTTDGLFVVISTAISNDIFKRVLVPRGIMGKNLKTEEEVDRFCTKIARVTTVLIGVLALIAAWEQPAYLGDLVLFGIMGTVSGVIGMVVYGSFSPKATPGAAIASLIIGVSVFLYTYLFTGITSVPHAGGIAYLTSIVTIILFSQFTKQTISDQHLDQFFVKKQM
ncbi:MAG: sodium:pantothenate symporter [Tindallia sp. MSAO_Bac2]|nr:MAG: sodium:pantothenate symporter [Tindallia sp. MSAO_Bac2]